MFGLGFGEILIIAIVALLLLGPDRLPEAAKTLGKGLREIRKATDDLKDQVDKEINLKELLEDKPAKPSLVPPVPVPARPIPGPSGPPPAATSDNVPGLEVALAEPVTVAEDYSSPSATAELSPEIATALGPAVPEVDAPPAPAAAAADAPPVPAAAEPAPGTPSSTKST